MDDFIIDKINQLFLLVKEDKKIDAKKIIQKIKSYYEFDGLCECHGCVNDAKWEGWITVVDIFNIPTGSIQKRRVCDEHKYLLNKESDA
jgi:hypothetical protein